MRPQPQAHKPPLIKPLPTKFGIGIETELVLGCRAAPSKTENAGLFAELMAVSHNDEIPATYPRMVSDLATQLGYLRGGGQDAQPLGTLADWVLAYDSSIHRTKEPCE